jgi:hypothetical protein
MPVAKPLPTLRRIPLRRVLVAMSAATVILGGCITGERPELVVEDPIRDQAVEAVLELLDRAGDRDFTADYDIIPSATGETTAATVRVSDRRIRVTVGTVDYLIDGSVSRTCVAGDCIDRIDDAPISNLHITHRFWGDSFAARLRLDAARNLSAGQGRTGTIAGRPATCVDLTVVGGTPTYCALDEVGLARYFGADVSIELTAYSPDVDPDAFDI